MKYYSLRSLLFFFEHEYNNDFAAIKKIVETFNDDLSDDETRKILFDTLHDAKMVEEAFEHAPNPENEGRPEEIIIEPGSGETMAVYEQFEISIGKKIIYLTINLN